MNNRIISLVCVAAFAAALTGCQSDSTDCTSETENETVQTTAETMQTVRSESTKNDIQRMKLSFPTSDELEKIKESAQPCELFLDVYSLDNTAYDVDLSTLSELDSVNSLIINGTVNDLSFIGGMDGLKSITFEHFFGSFETMPSNSCVISFQLSSSEVESMSGIENLSGLETVVMDSFLISDKSDIGKLTCLKELSLNWDECDNPTDLSFLGSLTELESFSFTSSLKPTGIESITACSKLRELSIFSELDNIDFVSGLSSLEYFYLHDESTMVYSLAPLGECKSLARAELKCCCSADGIEALEKALPECEAVY